MSRGMRKSKFGKKFYLMKKSRMTMWKKATKGVNMRTKAAAKAKRARARAAEKAKRASQ